MDFRTSSIVIASILCPSCSMLFQSIKKAEQIIAQLEQAEALSMDEYKRLAAEATALLKECKSHIEGLEKTLQ